MNMIFQWINGYLKCSFTGGNRERFFNMCRNHQVDCWNMKDENNIMYGSITLSDFWKIRSFIKKTGVRMRIEERHGCPFLVRFLNKRKGIFIGCAFCVIFMYLMTERIWCIEYHGNTYYTEEALTKHLIQNDNYYPGISKKQINIQTLENQLRLNFSDISWISAEIKGTSLKINIEERVQYAESEVNESVVPYIYAAEGGEIVSMITRSGTPLAAIGDVVNQGELLIDGNVSYLDDAMNVVENRMIGADGDVFAKIVFPYEKIYYYQQMSEKYHKADYQVSLVVGNYMYSLPWFQAHEEKDDDRKFYVTEIVSLLRGVSIRYDMYRPYEMVHSLKNVNEAKKEAENEMSDIFNEFYEKGVQILENNVKIVVYENRIEAKGNVVIVKSIGKQGTFGSDFTDVMGNGVSYEYNRNDD